MSFFWPTLYICGYNETEQNSTNHTAALNVFLAGNPGI